MWEEFILFVKNDQKTVLMKEYSKHLARLLKQLVKIATVAEKTVFSAKDLRTKMS